MRDLVVLVAKVRRRVELARVTSSSVEKRDIIEGKE